MSVRKQELNIPIPLKDDEFELLQKGIYDDPRVNVYINQRRDFAILQSQPVVDYSDYLPRVKKLGLENYKLKSSVFKRRFEKISHFLRNGISSLVEIGAAEGYFLEIVKHKLPKISLAAVEIDQSTVAHREKVVGSENYQNLDELCNLGKKYDVVCLFHLIEHIKNPSSFLMKIRQLMHIDSILIIEVPSLSDPLISLYRCKSYMRFYFQAQHPFVYSSASLIRLLEHNDLQTQEVINYQRYGLENHLNWMINKRPGGNELFRKIFSKTNEDYISELEKYGKTDTVIWVGKMKA